MKSIKITYFVKLFFCLFLLSVQNIKAQRKIDTDSLLSVIIQDMKTDHPDYQQNIQRALLGKKLAPDYLDFHLVLGRNYDLTKIKDSARYYYKYVIDKNPVYEDAFLYLINMDIEEEKYEEGLIITNKAIDLYPNSKPFQLRRIAIYALQGDTENELKYVKSVRLKFPHDADIEQRLYLLYNKINYDRIGAYYNVTTIDRSGVGPWHLVSVDYLRQRLWGSIIGRVNYARRRSSDTIMSTGLQLEAESYIFSKKNNYSFINVAFSAADAFPKIRLAYSYFRNFKKGWEADLGARYIIMQDNSDLKTLNIGVGKYLGSYWLNLRTYIQKDSPSLTFTSRYYFNTKYDYITLMTGYGTSPDDRTTAAQYDRRVFLNSYRLSAGFATLVKTHYIIGILITDNEQEYKKDKFQRELNFAFSLQYKF